MHRSFLTGNAKCTTGLSIYCFVSWQRIRFLNRRTPLVLDRAAWGLPIEFMWPKGRLTGEVPTKVFIIFHLQKWCVSVGNFSCHLQNDQIPYFYHLLSISFLLSIQFYPSLSIKFSKSILPNPAPGGDRWDPRCYRSPHYQGANLRGRRHGNWFQAVGTGNLQKG